MFERLLAQIDSEFGKRLLRIQIGAAPPTEALLSQAKEVKSQVSAVALAQAAAAAPASAQTDPFLSAFSSLQKTSVKNEHKKLGRNDPCWCGSGKKYKKCHYPN